MSIADSIKREGVVVGFGAIHRRIKKFVNITYPYLESLRLRLDEGFCADEVYVKVRGRVM